MRIRRTLALALAGPALAGACALATASSAQAAPAPELTAKACADAKGHVVEDVVTHAHLCVVDGKVVGVVKG
ncbi:hypothetical protein C3486_06525 [Streptomyces sp. Ru73]|uniref:hypothetical protein n=1 Tax=Streptomyces sp. Ru73 TaxID=2080748 RepID=UPI000CDCE297|nr:hypothetical protein [Streptomyces sp. Ru73]POX42123.1 hypothetical protein C3486_06525 [Streptomyces sp. Ru73]